VGCGWCCLTDQCEESHRLHGYQKRCPEIRWDTAANRYLCDLAKHPTRGEEFRKALAMGEGCCARFNGWRGDVRDRDG
jgi:hypothetical protein